jgi:Ethanolamine utilization protein EutJ (predicted chaperonin)
MLNKLSNIPGYLLSQERRVPVSGSSDNITSEQGQEIFLKVNPALEKIKYLRQQIIDREVIKDDCLIGVPIDDQLKEKIKEYNELVSYLKGFFAEQAVGTLVGHFPA